MTRRRQSPALRQAIDSHRRAAYREGILRAATDVFGRVGFSDVKMSDVAAEAGVSVGTLYNYFESKDELFAALIEEHHAAFRDQLAPASLEPDPILRIRRIVELCFEFIDERKEIISAAIRAGLFQAHVAAELAGEVASPAAELLRETFFEALVEAAESGLMRRDLDPRSLSELLAGVVDGLVHDWVRTGRQKSLVSQADMVMDVFLKGVQPR